MCSLGYEHGPRGACGTPEKVSQIYKPREVHRQEQFGRLSATTGRGDCRKSRLDRPKWRQLTAKQGEELIRKRVAFLCRSRQKAERYVIIAGQADNLRDLDLYPCVVCGVTALQQSRIPLAVSMRPLTEP